MAVYTRIEDDDLRDFVTGFDIGAVLSCVGIAQGIENSNFLLTTEAGKFILTLYEKRVRPGDLPFYLGLMGHLAGREFPCPVPVAGRDGGNLHTLSGRPAAIVTFLDGHSPRESDITAAHCRDVGTAVARLHLAAADFLPARPNDLSVAAWRPLYEPLSAKADDLRTGFGDWIGDELTFLEQNWPAGRPTGLPTGIVHTDMFPDNVFFRDGALSGVIDFYFACTDMLAIDLAVCLNAWCFRDGTQFHPERSKALLDGYEAVRPLDDAECASLPVLARGMAMRFLLTRLHDWFHTPEDAVARHKDPLDLVPLIEFHRSVSDSTLYGVG